MIRPLRVPAIALSGLILASCAARAARPLVDPFPLRFPLVEAGTFELEGHVAGQPWSRDGIVYYAAREGRLEAVVVPSRTLLWRRPAEGAGPAAVAAAVVPAAPRAPVLAVDGSTLRARDAAGRELWTFAAAGAISSPPVLHNERVFFGTEDRWFYCLRAGDGRKIWSRRLQGAPLHPAVVGETALAVAAANSVVYRLSAKGGSILSWEAVPSRIVYELAAAGPLVLISSASSVLAAIDLRSGKRAGRYEIPGVLAAGAVWSPPFVVLFVEDRDTGRQRILFLRPR